MAENHIISNLMLYRTVSLPDISIVVLMVTAAAHSIAFSSSSFIPLPSKVPSTLIVGSSP